MKKWIALTLAIVLMAALTVPVFAEDNVLSYDEKNNTQTSGVAVSYNVDPTFLVTIPASVVLDNQVTISVSDVVLLYGESVNVKIGGTSETDNSFRLRTKEGAVLDYTVLKGNTTVRVGDTVLTVDPTSTETSVKLTFVKPETYIYAGLYEGTVTFTIVVE